MKKSKIKIYLIMIFFIGLMLALTGNVSADSNLMLNSLKFEAQINEDASMDVTEYWDIDIEDTNTLYKYFETDEEKFSGITNVTVTEVTDDEYEEFTEVYRWSYHVTEDCYFGTENEDGNFEIAWGVGLDNSSDTRQYEISYTVLDAVSKNNDYAELYWQFIGNGFGVPARSVKGIITLPDDADSEEDIRVWGHTEQLNGTIYVIDTDTIEFELDGYNSGNMLEVRVLFPTEMISYSKRESSENILQKVIDEETKWVEDANRRRAQREYGTIAVCLVITLILDAILVKFITKYKNKFKQIKGKKYTPEFEIEYFRDIPRKNATPGEAFKLINKAIHDISSTSIGKIFSAGLLDLSLRGFVEFRINDTEDKKEKVTIILKEKNKEELEELGEEKTIYEFLSDVENSKNGITIKQLQKYMENNTSKVLELVKNVNQNIKSGLQNKELISQENEKEYKRCMTSSTIWWIIAIMVSTILMPVTFINTGTKAAIISYLSIFINLILSIIAITKCNQISKNLNVFTQKGVNEAEQWKGLKKFMEDYSSLDEKEVPEVAIWEKYLVFATAFGIADKVIKQLKLIYPNYEQTSTINSTTLYIAMNVDFASSFSSSISTSISTAYSSSSGGGGGFSGGGGGGRWPEAAEADAKIKK